MQAYILIIVFVIVMFCFFVQLGLNISVCFPEKTKKRKHFEDLNRERKD